MDQKLLNCLASPDFHAWRFRLWREISEQAITAGWVPENEVRDDGLIDWECDRWNVLHARLVEIKYLFRPPVSRSVHARFIHPAKGQKKIDVGFLSFHTSPHPTMSEKEIFEKRRAELLDWRARGGEPPRDEDRPDPNTRRRSPKAR